MWSPVTDTLAATEGCPARDRHGAPDERRDTALFSVHSSLRAGRPHVSFLWLCDGCEAGTRSGWTNSQRWNRRLCGTKPHACAHSPRRPAESNGAGTSRTRSGYSATHQGRSGLPARESALFDAEPHQARLRSVGGSLQCNERCNGQCQGRATSGPVAAGTF